MSLAEAKISAAASGVVLEGEDSVAEPDQLTANTQSLAEEYPRYYSSMVNLIKNSESRIKKLSEGE